MNQGVGGLVGPANVEQLQTKLFNDFTAVDHDVATCAAFSKVEKDNWVLFIHSFEAWYNIDPYSWSGYWSAGDLYDQGLQFQTQLIAWQQKIQSVGCALTEPLIAPPPQGVDWSSLKVIAASVAVVAGAVLLFPIIMEGTATARELRLARRSKNESAR